MEQKTPPRLEEITARIAELEAKKGRAKKSEPVSDIPPAPEPTEENSSDDFFWTPTAPPSPVTLATPPLSPATQPAPPPFPATPSGPPPLPATPPDKIKTSKEKKPTPKNIAEEVQFFIDDFGLESMILQEFKNLPSDAHRLKVVRDLKKRIVDVVKSKAETQYSEYLKTEMTKLVNPKSFIIFRALDKLGEAVVKTATKERDIRDLEGQIFQKLKSSDKGKALIKQDLEILVRKINGENVYIGKDENPYTNYLNINEIDSTTPEGRFTATGNIFASLPYEWGQEKSGKNKKTYDKIKAEYEKAKIEVLEKIKWEGTNGDDQKIAQILMLDNAIQMEQLLNTHPEFEKALESLGKTPDGLEKTLKWTSALTGRNWTNRGLMAIGFVGRMGAKFAPLVAGAGQTVAFWSTAIAAPAIGGLVGGARGYLRAHETLAEKAKNARHGKHERNFNKEISVLADKLQKDRSGEIVENVENKKILEQIAVLQREKREIKKSEKAENLTKKLQEMLRDVSSLSVEEKRLRFALIKRRLDYTKNQIENGLIDFGNAKSALKNQFDLITILNEAAIFSMVDESVIEGKFYGKLTTAINLREEKTSEAQKTFVRKQMYKGAALGAGLALAGYTARYVGEQFGWWGGQGSVPHSIENIDELEIKNLEKQLEELQKQLQDIDKPQASLKPRPVSPYNLHAEEPAVERRRKLLEQIETLKRELAERKASAEKLKALKQNAPVEPVKPIKTPQQPVAEPKTAPPVTPPKLEPEPPKAPPAKPTAPKLVSEPQVGLGGAKIESTVPPSIRSPISEFSLELGKNGVPKNLETVFTSIAANSMELPVDGKISEEFATKALNMGANLVKLSEGHDVAGITAEEFEKAATFKDGRLEIIGTKEINDILAKLQANADKNWTSGVLQSKGAASWYIGNINEKGWLKIIHADGLDKANNASTGITGHDEVTAEQIGEFKKVEAPVASGEKIADDAPDSVEKGVNYYERDTAEAKDYLNRQNAVSGYADKENVLEKMRRELRDTYDKKSEVTTNKESAISRELLPEPEKNLEGVNLEMKDEFKIGTEKLQKVSEVYQKNISYLRRDNAGQNIWNKTKYMEATKVFKDKVSDNKLKRYLSELQFVSKLEPKGKGFFGWRRPENVNEYIIRALQKIAQVDMKKLEAFKSIN